MGREAIDMAAWLPVIRERGWDLSRCQRLLQRLESAVFAPDAPAQVPPQRPADATVH